MSRICSQTNAGWKRLVMRAAVHAVCLSHKVGRLFSGPASCSPRLDPDKCQTWEDRCKINWWVFWVEFSCLKKCRKTTASYDLILLKIPGYVSISPLVPDFFLLTFRLNPASPKGNKCQLHKKIKRVLIFFFFPEHFELQTQSILLMIPDSDFSQMVNFS